MEPRACDLGVCISLASLTISNALLIRDPALERAPGQARSSFPGLWGIRSAGDPVLRVPQTNIFPCGLIGTGQWDRFMNHVGHCGKKYECSPGNLIWGRLLCIDIVMAQA
jgi:hypothetical protein